MTRVWPILALTALAASAVAEQPRSGTRKIWSDASTNLLGEPSPDGRFLTYVEPSTGDLALYEIATGDKRALTDNPPDAETFAYFSAVSQDSQQVAYAWFNEDGFYELWTVGVDGGAPRRLYSNPATGFVQPCDWSPDGKQILTLFFRKDNVSQIALVSAEDGSVRVLRTLSWFYPKKISFSPDGGSILYDSLTGDGAARDILLLAADGSAERKLVEHGANDLFPLWTPAGDGVVFASDRAGDMDLWFVRVNDGEAAGEPVRIARSVGRALPMGITRDGRYFYGLRAGRSDVLLAGFDGDAAGEPEPAGVRTAGRASAPDWAPDGRRLAYLVDLGSENYGRPSRGLVVWAPETRQETVLRPRLAVLSRVRWSPDGARLLASGSDGRGRSGLFAVDPDSGATEGIVRASGGEPRGVAGEWLDAESIAYVSPDRGRILRRAVDGREAEELFAAEVGERLRLLAATADGAWLAFGIGDDEAAREVRALRVEDGRVETLYRAENGAVTALEWLDRSLYITVQSVRQGAERAAVWGVALDGGSPERTALAVGPGGPRFAPDGDHVAFSSSDERSEVWALQGWRPAAPR